MLRIRLSVQKTEVMWVWSLGWEDPLEKKMATHSRSLAWRIPWTEEPGRWQSLGSQRVGHDWAHRAYMLTGMYGIYKGPSSQGYGFSCGHIWMWELVYTRLYTCASEEAETNMFVFNSVTWRFELHKWIILLPVRATQLKRRKESAAMKRQELLP